MKEVEFGGAMDVPNVSDTNSGCGLHPDAHGKALVHFSKTSVSDVCDHDKCYPLRLDPDAENFEIDNQYQIPGLLSFKELDNEKATGDYVQDQDYIGKIKELQASLDMVKNIVRPGCSQEVLNVVLGLVSALVNTLSGMHSRPRPHSSL